MDKPKHTPGPWLDAGKLTGGSIEVRTACGRMQVARINGSAGEQEANARLIAAAPELLDALRGLLSDPYLADPINNDRMLSARLAVRKATGEE